MKAIIKLLCLGLAVTAAPFAFAQPAAEEGVNWKKGVITVVGEGTAPEGVNAAKRRLMAKRAAMVDGYRKLLEELEGVHVTSETTVKNFETESDEVRSRVSGLVKGARLVEENITSDGVYEVRLEIPMYGQNSLASAVLLTSLNQKKTEILRSAGTPQAAAAEPAIAPVATAEAYTGVIVDARNLGAKPAMAPAILDEADQELYVASIPFDENTIVSQGASSYAKSLEEAKQLPRVGSRPLIVRAKGVKGPFQADLVLSAEEAKRLVQADQAKGFLKNLAVVIVH